MKMTSVLPMPEMPARNLVNEEIKAYKNDGVLCVRKFYSERWLHLITEALDEIMQTPTSLTGVSANFRSDLGTWFWNDKVRDLILQGPGACIVQQLFGSERVNFYGDQIFIKEKLTPEPTPWHHDLTFWPIRGDQIASIWTSLDPVSVETSALEFVVGSHLWGKRYKAVGIGGVIFNDEDVEELPDIEADRSKYNIVSWELEPGDALIFHPLTLHGAQGNRSPNRKRRAITTRWCGDDVTYQPRKNMGPMNPGLQKGDKLGGPIYPQILPEMIAAEIGLRLAGPIAPDKQRREEIDATLARLKRVPV